MNLIKNRRSGKNLADPPVSPGPKKPNKERLQNICTFADRLLQGQPVYSKDREQIFTLIKMYADSIFLDKALATVSDGLDSIQPWSRIRDNAPWLWADYKAESKAGDIYSIQLGVDPVVSAPYRNEKLSDSIAGIATRGNPFKQQGTAHTAELLLPMGVTIVTNGMHSASAGILKTEGILILGGSYTMKVYDVSAAYEKIRFDGDNYVDSETGKIICKSLCFGLGAIYELGRIIQRRHIKFTPSVSAVQTYAKTLKKVHDGFFGIFGEKHENFFYALTDAVKDTVVLSEENETLKASLGKVRDEANAIIKEIDVHLAEKGNGHE
jgi:hypothetical protein